MEITKLTVRVPLRDLDRAKQFAREHETTLTRLITEYLGSLPVEHDILSDAPIVRRLSGTLRADISEDDYLDYIEAKYNA